MSRVLTAATSAFSPPERLFSRHEVMPPFVGSTFWKSGHASVHARRNGHCPDEGTDIARSPSRTRHRTWGRRGTLAGSSSAHGTAPAPRRDFRRLGGFVPHPAGTTSSTPSGSSFSFFAEEGTSFIDSGVISDCWAFLPSFAYRKCDFSTARESSLPAKSADPPRSVVLPWVFPVRRHIHTAVREHGRILRCLCSTCFIVVQRRHKKGRTEDVPWQFHTVGHEPILHSVRL